MFFICDRMKLWCKLIGRQDLLEQSSCRDPKICASHFDRNQFVNVAETNFKDEAIPKLNLPQREPQNSSSSSTVFKKMEMNLLNEEILQDDGIELPSNLDKLHNEYLEVNFKN